MNDRPRMVIVPARRGRWRRRRGRDNRTPRVADDRVLHNDRLFGRFNARTVAVGADSRPVGMGDHLHAVADRAERTVDPAAVDPGTRRDASCRQNQRRSRQSFREILVHSTPRFPFYKKQGEEKHKI